MTSEIALYYWPTPNGWKIPIALEEMGLDYDIHWVDIGKGDQFDAEFLKISPNNKMPAIVDSDGPDGQPIAIFESGAILQYLARKTGKLYGGSERDRVSVDQWLMWQVAGLGPMAGQAHHFLKYAPGLNPPQRLPYAQDRYHGEVARLYSVLNGQLAANRYVAGDFFSIADIAIWGWAQGWEGQAQSLDDKPNLKRWLGEVSARPAVQKGRGLGAHLRDRKLTDEERKAANKAMFGRE